MAKQSRSKRSFPVSFRWGLNLETAPITGVEAAALKVRGLKTTRLTVNWPALQPAPDHFDPDEIALLRRSLTALRKNRFRSRLVLAGGILPPWFVRFGGWAKSENLEFFYHFLTRLIGELGDLIADYIIFDRPNRLIPPGGGWTGESPGQRGFLNFFRNQRALRNILLAHSHAYDLIREIHARSRFKSPEISLSLEITPMQPANPQNGLDLDRTALAHQRHHLLLLEALTEGLLPRPLGRREQIHDGPVWNYLELIPAPPARVRFDWRGIDRFFLKDVREEKEGNPDTSTPGEELLPLLLEIQNQTALPMDLILPAPFADDGGFQTEDFRRLAFLRHGGVKLRGCFFHSFLDKIIDPPTYGKPAVSRRKKGAPKGRSRSNSPVLQLEKILKNGIFDSADR